MKKQLITFLLTVFTVFSAAAHTQLDSSEPEENSVLAQAPEEIILNFKMGIRLTAVTLIKAGGGATRLNLEKSTEFLTDYHFFVDDLGSGQYVVEWRGLGEDGHILLGRLAYEVE